MKLLLVSTALLDLSTARIAQDEAPSDRHRASYDALARGVPEKPVPVLLEESTNGSLELGLHPDALPVLSAGGQVFVAASSLGRGRIVAFSGQEFLSSSGRSTFVGLEGGDALLRNAVSWAAQRTGGPKTRIVVDNEAVAKTLAKEEAWEVTVAERDEDRRDWSATALARADVAVVQANEWGAMHLDPEDVPALRAFLREGGGLLIAGSALHWSWWLRGEHGELPANLVAEGTGLRWKTNNVQDLRLATVDFGPFSSPVALWNAYLTGEELEGPDMARLPATFLSAQRLGRGEELDAALERLIAETPALPASASDPKAQLSAEIPAVLAPHPWPGPHPWAAAYPGLPREGAERVETEVVVDASWTGARPLGLFVPPGELVALELDPKYRRYDFWVDVGQANDDLRANTEHDEWHRGPDLQHGADLTEPVATAFNPYGGALYLGIPHPLEEPVVVRVRGAIPMATFTLGETDVGEWKRALETTGAPLAFLQARGRIRMVVPVEAAATVEDPASVLEFWSAFHATHCELAREPKPRRFESQWIFDPHVGWGYANALPDRIAFPLEAQDWALRTRTGDEDWWLFGHELGHQFQSENWTGGDLTEVAVNLFTLYTLNKYIHEGGERETRGFEEHALTDDELRGHRWEEASYFGKLQLFRQLVLEFGWDAYKRTFASYYEAAYPIDEFGGHMEGFAIRFSAIVERDLTDFFAQWKYPLSDAGAAKIQSFGHERWMPAGW